MGPCAVQNPTAPETFQGKSGKAHCDFDPGHTSVFLCDPCPVTTKIRGTVKERDLKISHTFPNNHFLSENTS